MSRKKMEKFPGAKGSMKIRRLKKKSTRIAAWEIQISKFVARDAKTIWIIRRLFQFKKPSHPSSLLF